MSTIGEFRQAIKEILARELEIDFVDGKLEGPVEGSDRGSIFPLTKGENPEAVTEEMLYLVVRVFKASETRRATSTPYDPKELEDLAELVQKIVAKHQTGLGLWFQRVTQVEWDLDRQMIEALVLGVQANPAV
jgi:hypothetical protein